MTSLLTERIADFAAARNVRALPPEVADYTGLIVFDTLVCGLAAARMERTRMAHKVIDRLGGPEEATVFGRSTKAPAAVAAAFNSEITYALDADDTLFNSAHFATIVVSSALAEAERVGASGDNLLRAVAVGYDMTARLNLACSFMEVVDGKMKWSELFGSGYGTLGTVVSAGLVSGVSRDRMIHALALAAATAPTARNTHNTERTELATYKYCPNMHVVQAGMTALILAEAGYLGEPDLLDLEPGFFEAQGFRSVRREAITEDIGDHWWILDSAVKYYPACRYTGAPIDALRALVREHGWGPDDIEHIEVRLNPGAYSQRVFHTPATSIEPDHRAAIHGAFNIPYLLALAVLQITPGPAWFDPIHTQDPKVWDIASRIVTAPDPELDRDWGDAVADSTIGRPRRTRASMTVRARGREYAVDTEFTRGDPWTPETRADWDSVMSKAVDFCGDLVSVERLERLARTVRDLGSVQNVATELAPLLRVE